MPLVLTWRRGQWIEITHKSGDVMRIRVADFPDRPEGIAVKLAFEDAPRNFEVGRKSATIRETARKRPLPELSDPPNPGGKAPQRP